ncbi:glycoside hydrolase family 2 protein [Cellulomonas hominis]|uniref:glycoside hydrolase family 2 protein n=1 Tax=Cellulomonas hominis TaxID=156981 RepID=UPI001B90D7C7|nr:glycoside hydrolase family 2 protein [Cellulomonas hominis]VTR75765.1 Exo-beta-D-glucosaminidase [Cellulomonas hominis]
MSDPRPSATRDLHDGWTVRAAAGPVPRGLRLDEVPATVPGSVHTDLMAAGLIDDPYLDDNEAVLGWIGRCDWEYRTRFAWQPDGHTHHDLVFDGLDTVATVLVNGTEVGRSANMHRTYRYAVAQLLVPGDNELVVRFASPVRYADAQSLALGYRPQVNRHPFNAIRKMACSFGWDWGPDTATSGIWRPVRLESWSTARLADVRVEATVDGEDGRVRVRSRLERDGSEALTLTVRAGGRAATVPVTRDAVTVDVDLPAVERWWPRGHGAQPLYDVDVELAGAGTVLETRRRRVGFRTVRLDLLPDDHGTSFTFVVNDVPVWVRGANWIPDDAFPHRVTRERYAARIAQAERAHVNLLRVWGGGIYEADDFYDLCDERGVLTWQDFLFACAAYAEEEPLRGEVEAEVRDNVARLAHHASLVLWNGSNENIWGFQEWGWEPRLDGRTWGLGYYTGLLPALLAELDPDRPYTPSSPWSGSLDTAPNDPAHGSMHSWDLWNRQDYPHYRDVVPRFLAEYGWQGPPAWSTLTRAVSDDPLTPESPGMLVHQKAMQGNDKLTDGLVRHLPLPDDMADWHWAMSLNQAAAVRLAVEHLRSWSPVCSGSVVWQLNDCWPVTSWSAIDGDGRAKPLLYALRHAYADRLVTIQPRDVDGARTLAVVVVNDAPEPWHADLVVRRHRFDGVELDGIKVAVEVAARSAVTVPVPAGPATPGDRAAEVLVATVDGERATWFYAEPRDSALQQPDLRVEAVATPSGARVRVTTDVLVQDLALLVDRVDPDAVVDDMLVTLLPGESVTFDVTAGPGLDVAALADPRVLRHTNQLVGGSRR